MKSLLVWLLAKTEGWKSILGYLALQAFGQYPLVLGAFNKLLEDVKSPASWVELVGHLLLALGLAWRAGKNLLPELSLKKLGEK